VSVGTSLGAWVMLAGLIWPFGVARADRPPMPDKLTLLDGTDLSIADLEGKVVVFVNVASKCGFTGQYEGLQNLYETFKDRGLVIVGVPCNQFGAQEPGTATDIAQFCSLTYGVDFPMLSKQDVNGDKRSLLYKHLVGGGTRVLWNFEKFLKGRDGKVIARYRSVTGPDSGKLVKAIEKALAE
jgi:glutathione peroxidase-family protein